MDENARLAGDWTSFWLNRVDVEACIVVLIPELELTSFPLLLFSERKGGLGCPIGIDFAIGFVGAILVCIGRRFIPNDFAEVLVAV